LVRRLLRPGLGPGRAGGDLYRHPPSLPATAQPPPSRPSPAAHEKALAAQAPGQPATTGTGHAQGTPGHSAPSAPGPAAAASLGGPSDAGETHRPGAHEIRPAETLTGAR